MSQNNKKLVNQLESFFEENQAVNSYNLKEFNLKENFSDSVLVKNSPGGSSGGDCWGGYTSRYDNSQEKQTYDLYIDIKYKLNPLAELIGLSDDVFDKASSDKAQEIYYSDIGSTEDNDGDYYGNYTKYAIFEVNILKFFKPLVLEFTKNLNRDNSKVKTNFEVLEGFMANFKQKEDVLFVAKVKNQRQEELEDKIKTFDVNKKKAKDDIKNNIIRYKQILEGFTSGLENFEQVSSKELKKLKDELKSIEESNLTTVKTNKPKKIK